MTLQERDDRMREEGREEGLKEGRKEGRKEGLSALIHSLSKYIKDERVLLEEIRSNQEYADYTTEEIKSSIAEFIQR